MAKSKEESATTQCAKELIDWQVKWTGSKEIRPEEVIGIMELIKLAYVNRAMIKLNNKQHKE